MSTESAQCPHCGQVQTGTAQVHQSEVKSDEPVRRPVGMTGYALTMQSSGTTRWLEIALTLVGLPVLLPAIVIAGIWAIRFRLYTSAGLFIIAIPVSSAAFYCALRAFWVDHWPALGWTLAFFGGASLRELLRWQERKNLPAD